MKNLKYSTIIIFGFLSILCQNSDAQIISTQRISITKADEFVIGNNRIPITERNDTTLFFDLDKAAFRVGEMMESGWVKDSLGIHSFAAGFNSRAKGGASTAFGNHTAALGTNSVAMGFKSIASSTDALALGSLSRASGRNSVAIGTSNRSVGNFSISIGQQLDNESFGSTVLGRYNIGGGNNFTWQEDDPLFELGNGNSNNNRSNAFTILKNGRTLFGKSSNVLIDRVLINSISTENALNVQVDLQTKFKVYSNGSISLGTENNGISDNDVYIQNALGIGAPIPEKDLDVRGGAQVKMNSGAANGSHITLHETSTNDFARLDFKNDNPETFWTIAAKPTADISGSAFNFFLGNVGNIMSLTGQRRVGIGTTTPSQKLEINGALKIGDSEGTPENGTLRYGNNGLEVYDNDQWNEVRVTPKKLEIGDEAYGGIIFWLDEKEEHGLVVSTSDLPALREWGTETCCYYSADGTGVYSGSRNTSLIIENTPGSSVISAAKACQDYTGGGYGDWYLPSRTEFSILRNASSTLANLTLTNGNYWTSYEEIVLVDVQARSTNGVTGTSQLEQKTVLNYVRPIRRF